MKKKKPIAAAPQPVILENGALQVYSYHPVSGLFIGTDVAFRDPLTPGAFLIAAGATEIAPPAISEGEQAVWNGSSWIVEAIPEPVTAPPPTTEQLSASARAQRNSLLAASDWTQLPDVPSWVFNNRAAWETYRQALRDVPQQEDFPTTINWPTAP